MIRACAGAKVRAMALSPNPCREELEAVVRHYHHVESEHRHARAEGSVRHHLELRLKHDQERFEHLLDEYVSDETVRRAWREFLHHRGGEPAGPPAIRPVLFSGRSDAGSLIEIRRDDRGELAIEVDGRLVERLPGRHIPIGDGRPTVFRLDGTEFREHFRVSPAALRALRELRAAGGDPPWVARLIAAGGRLGRCRLRADRARAKGARGTRSAGVLTRKSNTCL
jgi:hypothetical protein